jgi:formylglycine-generating enzyme required for sulfatase activity
MTVDLGALDPLPVAVTVNVRPSNAAVFVNGSEVRPEARGKIRLLPGQWTFAARMSGYATNTTSVTVAPGKPVTVNLVVVELPGLVWVEPGTFTMGSPATELGRFSGEGPQTVVTITKGFFMGRQEVTQGEYRAVMGNNPSRFTGDPNRPVEMVSWDQATNYCARLTERESAARRLPRGWVYRLPTEAEWEYACRAGKTTRFSYGDDPDYAQLDDYAWYRSNSGRTTHAVGQKQPNEWGLCDMHGNVFEWCLNLYGAYRGESATDPKGPASGVSNVIRGGSCLSAGNLCRSAYRFGYTPRNRYNYLGFRVVLAQAPGGVPGEAARIAQAPASQSVVPGLVATFTVRAAGTAPLFYQWSKDRVKLAAGARVSGVDTPTLTIRNLAQEDEGAYTVEVRNDWGQDLSQAATLTAGPPGFVWIKPGTFAMGSPASEQDRGTDEGPQTQVRITRGFWMGRHEVTQGEYEAVMGSNPSEFTGDTNRPAERVSWDNATNYCAKLTERERAAGRLSAAYVYRLPTEAEWEYACRAGTTNQFSFRDDPGYAKLGEYAWYAGNSQGATHPAGKKQPNPWGLCDTYGNVWEWCLDWYADSLPGGSVADPKGPASGPDHVFRGGSSHSDGPYCRSAFRLNLTRRYRGSSFGFRAVLAASQP